MKINSRRIIDQKIKHARENPGHKVVKALEEEVKEPLSLKIKGDLQKIEKMMIKIFKFTRGAQEKEMCRGIDI